MSTKEENTLNSESNDSNPSSVPAVVETQQEGLMHYSKALNEEVSQQMSLTVGYAQRLQNLIHSEVEVLENEYLDANADPSERTRKLSTETVENIKALGAEFREAIKLGVALAGVKMKIERGD